MADNEQGQETNGATRTVIETIRDLGDKWRAFKKRRAEAEREIARSGGRPGETQEQ